jgi:hypothetical protein
VGEEHEGGHSLLTALQARSLLDLLCGPVASLAVDVIEHGVVMSADSQRAEIRGGQNVVLAHEGRRARNPIIVRTGGGFIGLVGSVGTEEIEGVETAEWLRRFSAAWPDDDVSSFCERLGRALTEVWRRDAIPSVLEILVTGESGGELQFWFVRNSQGLNNADWTHRPPADRFVTKNDLAAYIANDALPGEAQGDVLRRMTYSFRQGVLLPAAPVFEGFGVILNTLHRGGVPGFPPIASLDDLGHFARVRMEFLKRLCTAKYGIFAEGTPTPIGGTVFVYGVDRDGRVCEFGGKGRDQVRVLRPGRTHRR